MKLTGKDIYALVWELTPVDETPTSWEDEEDQDIRRDCEALAAAIQEKYIAPLEQLALDWQKLVREDEEVNLDVPAEIENWMQSHRDLQRRTRELIGEEQVSGE